MKINRTFAALSLVAFSVPSWAFFDYFMRIDGAKYLQGDCITPTEQSLSFYGHYARIEGVISFEGSSEPGAYYLSFPVFTARTPLHPTSIDEKTQRVDADFCKPQAGTMPS